MTDRIEVRGVRAEGRHGFPEEREHLQPFVVDVDVIASLGPAARSDMLEETVDYVHVVKVIKQVVEGESFMLIESIAGTIADQVLALGADRARVRVSKPRAAKGLGADEVAVVVERSR